MTSFAIHRRLPSSPPAEDGSSAEELAFQNFINIFFQFSVQSIHTILTRYYAQPSLVMLDTPFIPYLETTIPTISILWPIQQQKFAHYCTTWSPYLVDYTSLQDTIVTNTMAERDALKVDIPRKNYLFNVLPIDYLKTAANMFSIRKHPVHTFNRPLHIGSPVLNAFHNAAELLCHTITIQLSTQSILTQMFQPHL